MKDVSRKFLWYNITGGIVLAAFIAVTLVAVIAPKLYAQGTGAAAGAGQGAAQVTRLPDEAVGTAFMSAAISMSVSCVAAGVAVGMTGSAAIGAVAERPEVMGRTILFVGLAEGIAIYGLIIAIIILGKV